MSKTILVAIDGSGHATRAVTEAAEISAALDASLILMNARRTAVLPPELAENAKSEDVYVPRC